jgi:hypothetical protein
VLENNVGTRYSEGIDKLLNGEDAAGSIKSQRIRWLGHVDMLGGGGGAV